MEEIETNATVDWAGCGGRGVKWGSGGGEAVMTTFADGDAN